jgi:hypothetical protein
MPWFWSEIESDWLAGATIALPADEVILAFNLADALLGHEWVTASRIHSGGVVRGSSPTLRVATMGQRLRSLAGAQNAEYLLSRLRRGDHAAEAELVAINLVRRDREQVELELDPPISEGPDSRKSDFRIRTPRDAWTYVEVTRPDVSKEAQGALTILHQIAALVLEAPRPTALEVFLRKLPTEDEVADICRTVRDLVASPAPRRVDMSGVCILTPDASPPGQVLLLDHPGEPNVPRLGVASGSVGGGEAGKHISVRMPFSDERADQFLRFEARQLPKTAAALIMVEMGRAPGGFNPEGLQELGTASASSVSA